MSPGEKTLISRNYDSVIFRPGFFGLGVFMYFYIINGRKIHGRKFSVPKLSFEGLKDLLHTS